MYTIRLFPGAKKAGNSTSSAASTSAAGSLAPPSPSVAASTSSSAPSTLSLSTATLQLPNATGHGQKADKGDAKQRKDSKASGHKVNSLNFNVNAGSWLVCWCISGPLSLTMTCAEPLIIYVFLQPKHVYSVEEFKDDDEDDKSGTGTTPTARAVVQAPLSTGTAASLASSLLSCGITPPQSTANTTTGGLLLGPAAPLPLSSPDTLSLASSNSPTLLSQSTPTSLSAIDSTGVLSSSPTLRDTDGALALANMPGLHLARSEPLRTSPVVTTSAASTFSSSVPATSEATLSALASSLAQSLSSSSLVSANAAVAGTATLPPESPRRSRLAVAEASLPPHSFATPPPSLVSSSSSTAQAPLVATSKSAAVVQNTIRSLLVLEESTNGCACVFGFLSTGVSRLAHSLVVCLQV